jgi:hypothetical protein
MSPTTADGWSEPDAESDKQADAMKDQLRKDVASWSAARSGSAGETPDMAGRSATQAAKQPPAARATRQKAKPAPVTVAVPAEKKPFRMSYDGTTDRDYIAQRIKLGAR